MSSYTNHDKADAAHREVGQRKKVFPRLVAQGRMTAEFSAKQIALMEAIRDDYRGGAESDQAALTPSLDLAPPPAAPDTIWPGLSNADAIELLDGIITDHASTDAKGFITNGDQIADEILSSLKSFQGKGASA